MCYIHDKTKTRSEYIIKYVFLWKMTPEVIKKIFPDYKKIISAINAGKAHEIHQPQHNYLTLCPKHGSSKKFRTQPFSDEPAEIKAFRIKNKYMNEIIVESIGKTLEKNSWKDD